MMKPLVLKAQMLLCSWLTSFRTDIEAVVSIVKDRCMFIVRRADAAQFVDLHVPTKKPRRWVSNSIVARLWHAGYHCDENFTWKAFTTPFQNTSGALEHKPYTRKLLLAPSNTRRTIKSGRISILSHQLKFSQNRFGTVC